MAATSSGRHNSTYQFKVVLLGEGCVGKTSLVLRYVEKKFYDKHESTLQASFLNSSLTIDGKRVNLAIWDTAGQERFHALGPIYYRDSNGALLVYDITDEDSFQKVKTWVKELKKMLGNQVCIGIVGNKIDLEKDRKESSAEAEEYALSVGAKHYTVSAKFNRGINELFYDLSLRMVESADSEPGKGLTHGRTNNQRKNVLVVDDAPQATKSSCC